MPKAESPLVAALDRLAAGMASEARATAGGQAEDQLKRLVQAVVEAAGVVAGSSVETFTEARTAAGRPDIGVLVQALLCGHIELKAPGKGARPERFKGSDRDQWERFKALPNLLYTDGLEWALYRSGERRGDVIRIGDGLHRRGAVGPAPEAAAALDGLLRDFLLWQPVVPSSPRGLAELLAPLCHFLRREVVDALARPKSSVAQVAKEWREALFPDADDAQFADAYAQTITYTLLLARFEGDRQVRMDTAEATIRRRHGLLAQCLRILGDPQARQEIEVGVSLLERVIRAVDVAALQKRRADPWLYFYEDFLAAYDPQLRNDRGVYYTPVEIVQSQCRLVTELLATRFRKRLGFADDGVVLLDPAAGTGAYLLAALQMGLDQVEARLGKGAVPGRASETAKNLHAFEILVGPYAVAHLRLTQALLASEAELPREGVHVYLTDTLESPHAKPLGKLPLQHKPLADEHRRAQHVKADVPVLVCIGNPPYDRQKIDPREKGRERKGGWVRFGESKDDRAILQDFLEPAAEAGAGVHLKNLYNDYVYFWRWALWKVFEEKTNPKGEVVLPASPGIVSFISASSYLRGPGFAGMRQVMRQTFDELWIIDLEGDNLGARKTENVFAIQTPVAVAIGVRYGAPHPETTATVHYTRIEGTREEKLAQLAAVEGFGSLEWRGCFEGWMQPFLPRGEGDYFSWPLVTDLFPWQHSGVQFKRTWPIAETKAVLRARWQRLLALRGAARAEAFRETPARTIDRRYSSLGPSAGDLPALAVLEADAPHPPIARYGYRSFDRQWALADPRLADRLRPALWEAHSPTQLYLTSLLSGVLGLGPAATVSAQVPDLHHFRGSFGGRDVIPLYRDAGGREANVTRGLLEILAARLRQPVSAEDLFAYSYALLASPAFVDRFSEELTVPGPRLPLTRDPRLFRHGVELGRRLIVLHTFGERFALQDGGGAVPQGTARCTKAISSRPEGYPERFSYDGSSRTLRVGAGEFAPVDRQVFEFSVSGFEVVKSWLAYRMKNGAGRRSSGLDDVRPERWTADMTEELLELLWTLEATTRLFPELRTNLEAVLTSDLFTRGELPEPQPVEHRPLKANDDSEDGQGQTRLPQVE